MDIMLVDTIIAKQEHIMHRVFATQYTRLHEQVTDNVAPQ